MLKTLQNPSGYDWAKHVQCRTEDLRSHDREIAEAVDACLWVLKQRAAALAAGDHDLEALHVLQLARRSAYLNFLYADRSLIVANLEFCASVAVRLEK